jgi:hypothetical protein
MGDTYRVVNYFDVWGNEQDGWEVNNLCEEGYITVKDYTNVEEIVKALQNMERPFLNEQASAEALEVMNDYEFIEFYEKRNGCPLFRLELKQNNSEVM